MSGGALYPAAAQNGPVAPPFNNTAPGAPNNDDLRQLLEWAQALPDAVLQGYWAEP